MSILNGAISSSVIHPTPAPFGRSLHPSARIPLPGCADVAVSPDGALAYVACRDMLVTYSLPQEGQPVELGRISGLHACRQIAVSEDGIAFVTARPDGLFIIDARNPADLKLLKHLDTLELATGVCVAHGLCLIANRHMGVEIWDVSDPARPEYCAAFYAGEAQSVCVDGSYAYVGDWMNRRVFIVSIADPRKPQTVSSFQVDGFADGVFVRGGLCLAASGHHSAALKNRRKYKNYPYMTPQMIQEGYGCGHGLTLVDVSIPDAPEFLSEIKFPPFFGDVDTWRVTASGFYAYVADTHNGVFAVDISNPLSPVIVAHYQLPAEECKSNTPPALQSLHAAAMGIASGEGKLLVAGVDSGLHILDFEPAHPPVPCAPQAVPCPSVKVEKVFDCKGQIHSFIHQAGHLLLACGDDGLYALPETGGPKPAFHVSTQGIAHDAAWMNGFLFVAEGAQGVSSWTFSPEEGFHFVSRWMQPERCARQIVPLPQRSLLAVQLEVGQVGFLETRNDGSIKFKKDVSVGGMLYHRHLCRTLHPSGFLAALPLSCGMVWIDTDTLNPAPPDWRPAKEACPFEDGAAIEGDRIWVIRARRCGFFRDPCRTADAVLPGALHPVTGAQLRGMPFVMDHKLILLNRITGVMERLDISQEDTPKLLDRTVLPAHPEFAAMAAGTCWIACGHDGLYRILPA